MIKDILRVALVGGRPTGAGWTGIATLAAGLAVSVGLELVDAPVGVALLAVRMLEATSEPAAPGAGRVHR